MLNNFLSRLALLFILTIPFSCAYALDVYQTVDLSEKGEHPYLSNHLKAGDTITIRLIGGEFKNPEDNSVIFSRKNEDERKIRVKLDPLYYIPEPGEKYSRCSEQTLKVVGSSQGGDGDYQRQYSIPATMIEESNSPDPSASIACIQRKFRVIGNYGTYTILDVVEIEADGNSETESIYMNVVMVEKSSGVSLNFAGGFFISGLTDPVYYSEVPNDTIKRNKSAEDKIALGLAFFMHTCNETWTTAGAWKLIPTCLSLGLGLSDQSGELSYFPGLTWTWGPEFYITAGAHFAEIETLPKGLKEGEPLTSANDLNTLDSKFDVSYFVSISYKFLGTGAKDATNVYFSPSK